METAFKWIVIIVFCIAAFFVLGIILEIWNAVSDAIDSSKKKRAKREEKKQKEIAEKEKLNTLRNQVSKVKIGDVINHTYGFDGGVREDLYQITSVDLGRPDEIPVMKGIHLSKPGNYRTPVEQKITITIYGKITILDKDEKQTALNANELAYYKEIEHQEYLAHSAASEYQQTAQRYLAELEKYRQKYKD